MRATGRNRIRRWWHDATHASCPVCGQIIGVGREWDVHKSGHNPAEWRSAIQAANPRP